MSDSSFEVVHKHAIDTSCNESVVLLKVPHEVNLSGLKREESQIIQHFIENMKLEVERCNKVEMQSLRVCYALNLSTLCYFKKHASEEQSPIE